MMSSTPTGMGLFGGFLPGDDNQLLLKHRGLHWFPGRAAIQRASGLCSLQLADCAINFSKAIQTQTSCFGTDRSLFCVVLPAAKGKHLGSTWLYLRVQLRIPEQNCLVGG